MASIRFKTYGKGVSNAPVYIRFTNGRDCQFEIKTGIFIPNSDYLKEGKTRRVAAFSNQQEVQTKLSKLESHVVECLNRTSTYNKAWLKGIIDEFNGIVIQPENECSLLIDMIDKYCIHILNSVTDKRTNGTVKSYKVTRARLVEYQKFIKHNVKVENAGIEFKNDFIAWCRNVQKYSPATFIKSIRQIRTVVKYAKRIGYKTNDSLFNNEEKLDDSKTKRLGIKPVFVTSEEIDRLFEFKGTESLQNARDWFLISCWTGCRVSDLMGLSMDNVFKTIQGETAIRYTQKKTGATVITPFHPHVGSILKKHNGFPRPISDQKYNSYIKEVCRLVGINQIISGSRNNPVTKRKESGEFPKYELITSHTGRRSFASNHYGKFPIEMLMLVTGHKTVKQFLEYVGENPQEHISTLNQYYREFSQQFLSSTEKIG